MNVRPVSIVLLTVMTRKHIVKGECEMTTINHWGVWVDSEEATTGVLNVGSVAWEWLDNEHCLTCEEWIEELDRQLKDGEIDEDEYYHETESIECDSGHERIIGDWIKDNEGLWDADRVGGEFAAIENESTVQVIWSRYTKRGALCSPCYPGQVDLDTPGDWLAYTLPDYLIRGKE